MNAALQQFLALVRRNPTIVASISVIVLAGAATFYLWHRQQDLTFEHDEIRHNGEDMLQSLTSHARVNTEIDTVKAALDRIDKNLINEGDLAENLGYFYQVETASRIRFTQVSQLSSQPQPADNPYKAVPFSLRASGSYRQIMRLLRELESGQRLLRIRTYSLAGSDGDADLVTLDLTVELLARP
jgi:Tfp pilus assembly protein PilO